MISGRGINPDYSRSTVYRASPRAANLIGHIVRNDRLGKIGRLDRRRRTDSVNRCWAQLHRHIRNRLCSPWKCLRHYKSNTIWRASLRAADVIDSSGRFQGLRIETGLERGRGVLGRRNSEGSQIFDGGRRTGSRLYPRVRDLDFSFWRRPRHLGSSTL